MTTTVDSEAVSCLTAMGVKPREAVKLLEMARREYQGDDVGTLAAKMLNIRGRRVVNMPTDDGVRPGVEKNAAGMSFGASQYPTTDLSWTRQSVRDMDYGWPTEEPPARPEKQWPGLPSWVECPAPPIPPKAASVRRPQWLWRLIAGSVVFVAGMLIGRLI